MVIIRLYIIKGKPIAICIDNIGNLLYFMLMLSNREPFFWLYALALEDGCIYVGITSRKDPSLRIAQHIDNRGSQWTKVHKFKDIISVEPVGYISEEVAQGIEQTLTLEYMHRYGHNKVRGGFLCFSGAYTKLANGYLLRNIFSRPKTFASFA